MSIRISNSKNLQPIVFALVVMIVLTVAFIGVHLSTKRQSSTTVTPMKTQATPLSTDPFVDDNWKARPASTTTPKVEVAGVKVEREDRTLQSSASPSEPPTADHEDVPEAPPVTIEPPMFEGDNRALGYELMITYGGFDPDQWECLDNLWTRESGWNTYADNPNSSAYGIPQALPGSKMGPGWQDDPAVQIRWGLEYIHGRYGTPCGAWAAFKSKGWY